MKPLLTRRRFIGTAAAAVAGAPYLARGATGETAGFEIGIATDAQYADIAPQGTRFYRTGIARLGEAIEHFNRKAVRFCVHLGDLIDRDWQSFGPILRPFAQSRSHWHQLLGNHDFSVADEHKPGVPTRMGMPLRYHFFDEEGFRFVILDTNDVSTYAHATGTPAHKAAAAELERLVAANVVQAKPWNGGLGVAQLTWLERTCGNAAAAGRKVILLAHHPVAPAEQHNLWNADQVLAIVSRHRNVVAWFNGHNHAGHYAVVDGVPFVTLRGMVETENTTAFVTAQFLPDRIVLTGHGREPSRELVFRS